MSERFSFSVAKIVYSIGVTNLFLFHVVSMCLRFACLWTLTTIRESTKLSTWEKSEWNGMSLVRFMRTELVDECGHIEMEWENQADTLKCREWNCKERSSCSIIQCTIAKKKTKHTQRHTRQTDWLANETYLYLCDAMWYMYPLNKCDGCQWCFFASHDCEFFLHTTTTKYTISIELSSFDNRSAHYWHESLNVCEIS